MKNTGSLWQRNACGNQEYAKPIQIKMIDDFQKPLI